MTHLALPTAIKTLTDTLDNVLIIQSGRIIYHNLAPSHKVLIKTIEADDHSTLTIETDKSTVYDRPLFIFYLATEKAMNQTVKVTIKERSKLTLVEYFYADHHQPVDVKNTINLETFAELNHMTLSRLYKGSASTIMRYAAIGRGAIFRQAIANFNDESTHQDNHIELIGDYAIATTKTIAITAAKEQALYKTLVEHKAPKTEGYIEHYGVAHDESTLLFEGVGKIHKNMKRSIAKQSNKGILIGEQARLDANPLLLIDEYDVEAGHGAAIGQIDEDQLYYLMSRGLDRKDAERLIINGFLAPFNDAMPSDALKDHMRSLLNQKIR